MTAGTEDPLAFVVDGLHDLAERLEQTGILVTSTGVGIHADYTTDAGQRLADALGLTDRYDYTPEKDNSQRRFTTWDGQYDGVKVTVFGQTPEEDA